MSALNPPAASVPIDEAEARPHADNRLMAPLDAAAAGLMVLIVLLLLGGVLVALPVRDAGDLDRRSRLVCRSYGWRCSVRRSRCIATSTCA